MQLVGVMEQTIPDGYEPSVEDGFLVRAFTYGDSTTFSYHKRDDYTGKLGSVTVRHPRKNWSGRLEPALMHISQSQVDCNTSSFRALADCINCASIFCDALNADIEERMRIQEEERKRQYEQYRREREEERIRRAKEREERIERTKKVQELLQWELTERFRLNRNDAYGQPMKATVFGTIRRVERGMLFSTSEKGKHMRIHLDRITKFELRDPDDPKKYKLLFYINERGETVFPEAD